MHTAVVDHSVGRSGPFELRDRDTEEAEWARLLADCPSWSPKAQELMIVAPHPDDEVLGAGGLIRASTALGAKVTVLSVTDGERAEPCWRGLANVRRELKCALRKLSSTHVSVTRLGLPEGRIAAHLNRLRNAIMSLCSGPVTLIAPYERDGHPDHDAVGGVCCEVARSQQIPIARYAIWAWQRPPTKNLRDARWGKFALSNDARRAKARAVQCFRPRLRRPCSDPDRSAHVFSHFERPYEAFLL